jgi:hypothetical protein
MFIVRIIEDGKAALISPKKKRKEDPNNRRSVGRVMAGDS